MTAEQRSTLTPHVVGAGLADALKTIADGREAFDAHFPELVGARVTPALDGVWVEFVTGELFILRISRMNRETR